MFCYLLCSTNYPDVQWFNISTVLFAQDSAGQEFRKWVSQTRHFSFSSPFMPFSGIAHSPSFSWVISQKLGPVVASGSWNAQGGFHSLVWCLSFERLEELEAAWVYIYISLSLFMSSIEQLDIFVWQSRIPQEEKEAAYYV